MSLLQVYCVALINKTLHKNLFMGRRRHIEIMPNIIHSVKQRPGYEEVCGFYLKEVKILIVSFMNM